MNSSVAAPARAATAGSGEMTCTTWPFSTSSRPCVSNGISLRSSSAAASTISSRSRLAAVRRAISLRSSDSWLAACSLSNRAAFSMAMAAAWQMAAAVSSSCSVNDAFGAALHELDGADDAVLDDQRQRGPALLLVVPVDLVHLGREARVAQRRHDRRPFGLDDLARDGGVGQCEVLADPLLVHSAVLDPHDRAQPVALDHGDLAFGHADAVAEAAWPWQAACRAGRGCWRAPAPTRSSRSSSARSRRARGTGARCRSPGRRSAPGRG